MRKILSSHQTTDGYPAKVIQEKTYRLSIMQRYWVYVYALKDNSIVIYARMFRRKDKAVTHANTLNYQAEIEKII